MRVAAAACVHIFPASRCSRETSTSGFCCLFNGLVNQSACFYLVSGLISEHLQCEFEAAVKSRS
ncbi:hypothetical protein JOB18_010426 [Solea senegalensis]|uniref:Secreted protein n=1 Tax=Solea senegalensis TaxID=28829 RepID=A0AAV6R0R3_SOLSE|nr:hypothetical protein JOB18_010426 [Solea senegalensis]